MGGHTLAEFVFLLVALLPGGYTLHYVFSFFYFCFRLFVWKLVCSNEITLLIVYFRNNLFRKKICIFRILRVEASSYIIMIAYNYGH